MKTLSNINHFSHLILRSMNRTVKNFTKLSGLALMLLSQRGHAQRTVKELIRFSLNGPAGVDYTVLYFDTVATANFDSKSDAYKLYGNSLNIFTQDNNGVRYSINAQSAYAETNQIAMGFKISKPGTYTIKVITRDNEEKFMNTQIVNLKTGETFSTALGASVSFVVDSSMINKNIVDMFAVKAEGIKYANVLTSNTVTQVADYSIANVLGSIFPNPTHANNAMIQLNDDAEVLILDMEGRVELDEQYKAEPFPQMINGLERLKNGVYEVILKGQGGKKTFVKLVIE